LEGYLLLPQGTGVFPGVVVPYYEPETSVGLSNNSLRDFASELAKRGFAAIAIGSPGGDARKPELAGAECQPLHFLGYIAANCFNALASLPAVDPARIAIVGHSYGGKWAMFAACFYEKFAAGVWSDPGIVFDNSRANINYWEPWYLGKDAARTRAPGIPTAANPATGAYRRLFEQGHDLHEVQSLMAPRPFLVSGGAEDPPERWLALNRIQEVYALFGASNRVAMSNRPKHDPTPSSNEQIYKFLEHFLKQGPENKPLSQVSP
jgi:pimeloyl-ACP methyl ester carboxylesterase